MPKDGKFDITALEGHTPFFEDEPGFAFRGRDRALVITLMFYEDECRRLGSPESHLAAIREHRARIEEWQGNNMDKIKVPD